MSLDRLIKRIDELKNPSVAGLDPRLEYVPRFIQDACFVKYGRTLEGAAAALLEFNKALIDALYDVVPAIKPQAAYYEMYGWQGVRTLAETIRYAQEKGMFVMTDGKRNDIGATMTAYATAHLGKTDVDGISLDAFGADALTVNGYLGTDGIQPLLDMCAQYDKGIFVLAKTSNPSSGELQDREIDGKPVYEIMGEMCENWGADQIGAYGYSSVGAVVGATYPEQLAALRKKLPHTMFLVPGYGAQGGGAQGVAGAFDADGRGAVVNSSRAIMCAWKKEPDCPETDFAQAARREAIRMRDDITAYL
ncbi:orotidine-5'-phosphate decarboxylase [uncultured Ruminococcus sp.]|mgnify:CR=1 FL=1|uniref:orotidine-5'-phosphate decarboxylase n=1 Tax=uncultured Ruminococcus sp. TaxID=165186 RepID=UPI00262B3FCF|nr:orotidine-5'-phosphate decarboxylase [uncultured Ruminococcus sp.]